MAPAPPAFYEKGELSSAVVCSADQENTKTNEWSKERVSVEA